MHLKYPLMLFLFCIFVNPCTVFGERGSIGQPRTFSGPRYVIEELVADLHSDGTILQVRGRLKNLSHAVVTGRIIIHLKNASNDTVHAVESVANSNKPIQHGENVYFEVSTYIGNMPGVNNVSVEFIENYGHKIY